MPPIERRRRGRSDLNQRPVSNEFVSDLPVGQRTADDEMIVAMNHNADHRDLMSAIRMQQHRHAHLREDLVAFLQAFLAPLGTQTLQTRSTRIEHLPRR